MEQYKLITTLSSQQWELAKGNLRSIVALLGSSFDGHNWPKGHPQYEEAKFTKMSEVVEAFIKDVEDNEYHL